MGMLSDESRAKLSTSVVMLVFFIYKSCESLLQPTIRIEIYKIVCLSEGLPLAVCSPKERSYWSSVQHSQPASAGQETEVQRKASNYLLAYRILLNVPAVCFCLFAGSWSDRVGRKYPMMLPPLGAVLAVFCFAIGSLHHTNTLTWFLAGAAVYGLFGKSTILTMACTSYMADNSTKENRTQRLAQMMAMNFFGLFLGSLLTGFTQKFADLQTVLIAVLIINLILELAIVLLVQESDQKYDSTPCIQLACPCINVVTKSISIRDSVGFLLRKRPQQSSLIFLFCLLGINQICKQGEQDVLLLLVENAPFNWPGEYYGYYLSLYYAFMGLNLMLVLPLMTKFAQPRDCVLIAIGLFMKSLRLVITSLADQTWLLFASNVLGCFAGFVVSATKSLVSKLVDDDEIGQTFSLVSCAEAVANLIGPSLFTPVYSVTVDMFPGMVFSLDAAIHFFLLCCVLKFSLIGTGAGDASQDSEIVPLAKDVNKKTSISVHRVRRRSDPDEVDYVSDSESCDHHAIAGIAAAGD